MPPQQGRASCSEAVVLMGQELFLPCPGVARNTVHLDVSGHQGWPLLRCPRHPLVGRLLCPHEDVPSSRGGPREDPAGEQRRRRRGTR
eukprot:1986459-Lingulodinium_polyedra.AAC.1